MTHDEAKRQASERNAEQGAGHWFAREAEGGEWDLVRVAQPFGPRAKPIEGQLEKRGAGPDSSSADMPGLVQPWAAG